MQVLLLTGEDTDSVKGAVEAAVPFVGHRSVHVNTAGGLADALALAGDRCPEIVLIGCSDAGMGSAEIVAQTASAMPGAAVIALTGDDSADMERAVMEAGAQDVLVTPLADPRRLAGQLRRACLRQRRIMRLQSDALTDELTGLLNRRGFLSRARSMLKLADRIQSPVLIGVLDVDELKVLNDRQGHVRGDELLADVAEVLGVCLRGSDAVGRLGGDEFGFAALGAAIEHAQVVVRRIRTTLGAHCAARGRPYTPSVSAGWSVHVPGSEVSLEDLLQCADRLMYTDKVRKCGPTVAV